MNPHYPFVAERAGHRCEYCHAPESIFNLPFEVEHIIPTAHGGADDASNWALACRACNVHKHDYLDGVDPVTGETVRLFHPRQDVWAEHFHANGVTGEIEGRTSIGRATVERLQMNAPTQVRARLQWRKLGIFP